MTQGSDSARYRANLQGEVDGAALYRALAEAEPDPNIAKVYSRLAAITFVPGRMRGVALGG